MASVNTKLPYLQRDMSAVSAASCCFATVSGVPGSQALTASVPSVRKSPVLDPNKVQQITSYSYLTCTLYDNHYHKYSYILYRWFLNLTHNWMLFAKLLTSHPLLSVSINYSLFSTHFSLRCSSLSQEPQPMIGVYLVSLRMHFPMRLMPGQGPVETGFIRGLLARPEQSNSSKWKWERPTGRKDCEMLSQATYW